jgi:hypothetical protein
MTLELTAHEKITRIWSERRGRFVIVRVRYQIRNDAAAEVLLLHSFEEIEDGY